MTDTCTAKEKLRDHIASARHEQYFLDIAYHLIDELALRVDSGGDREKVIREYYEKVTGAKAYSRPSYGLLPAKARIILMARDVFNGVEPKKRYLFGNEAQRSESYASTLRSYEEWLAESGKSASTVRTRTQRANVLFAYLESTGIVSLGQFDAITLVKFVAWLGNHYTPVGKSNILYTLRNLFVCPAVSAELRFEPLGLLSNLHTPKHNEIPSVYAKYEVRALLESLDRNTDAGRALYLIVVLAAVYGLRSSDIRELRLQDVDWHRKLITIVQHKTGFPLQLPLTDGVKYALLDYLKNTRAECEHENILIKHRGCAEPYSDCNHFSNKVRAALIECGVDLQGRRAGLHSLRHTLATGMLSDGVPLNEIASVLGHRSLQSTATYVWADIEHLRIAALEVG